MTDQIKKILPNSFYRPSYIEALLGIQCLRTLRKYGLRAVGGWYLGEIILDSFKRAWQAKSCQRVLGEEVNHERKEHAEEKTVAENHTDGKVQRVSKRTKSESLRGQLEKIERTIRQEAV